MKDVELAMGLEEGNCPIRSAVRGMAPRWHCGKDIEVTEACQLGISNTAHGKNSTYNYWLNQQNRASSHSMYNNNSIAFRFG